MKSFSRESKLEYILNIFNFLGMKIKTSTYAINRKKTFSFEYTKGKYT